MIFTKVGLIKGISKSLLASGKVIFRGTLIFMVSLSFSQILQCFESTLWLSLQLLEFKLFLQVSSVWYGSFDTYWFS